MRGAIRRSRAAGGWVAVALGLALVASGCGGGTDGGSRSSSPRAPGDPPEVVLLGIDGFDWNIVDPLVEAGRMPVLAELLARGARADLLTLVPLEKSPVIWTTIATGRLPEQQGRGFLISTSETEEGAKAYTAWSRSTRAFWNVLPDAGRRVAVLGWLETWPAEPIDGIIVSDYVQYDVAEREKRARFLHRTWPEELYDEIEPLVVYPNDIDLDRLRPLLGSDPPPLADLPTAWATGLRDLQWILAGDLTFTAIGRRVLRESPEDVVAIYLRGPDAVCHKFWGDREHLAGGGGDSKRAAIFGPTVDLYFEETDRLIGNLLEDIDLERTTLLLVSDHGFQGARRAMDGSPMLGIYMHRELGTLLAVGPWAAGEGVRAEGARVQDIFPTLLHALDLPVGEDLDGVPALSILGPAGGRDRPVRTVETWETGERPRLPEGIDSPVAEQIEERIRSLGYAE